MSTPTLPLPGSVAVVGGGIAGLVAAVEAAELASGPVTLVDGGPGRARTTERDGVHLNEGAHALYLEGALAGALGSWGIDVPGGAPDPTGVWAVHDDRLTRFPTSPAALARTHLLGLRSKAAFTSLQLQLQRMDPATLAGRSVAEWLAAKPADLRRVVEGLVRLTSYVNSPDLLDAGAAVAQLQRGIRGGVRYVDGGWATIVTALHRRFTALGGTTVRARVEAVTSGPEGVTLVTRDGGLQAEAAIVATGSPANASRLLGISRPAAWDLVPVEASCLDIWTRQTPSVPLLLDLDRDLYLSTHAPVADLAPPGVTLVSVLHYLPAGTAPADHGTEVHLLREHAARAGITEDAILGQRALHRMTVANGFPLAERRGVAPSVEVPGLRRVFVAGDWVDSGAMLADASAASAIEAAGAAVAVTRHLLAAAGRG